MNAPDTPVLAGIHHLKLPVTDLARSRDWYESRLGYEVRFYTHQHHEPDPAAVTTIRDPRETSERHERAAT
jgi:catechol 2,3-dioxygenase-like lactoylglutathione lyase family enzyme